MINRYFALSLAAGLLLPCAANVFAEGTGLTRAECNKAAMFAAGPETARHYAPDNDLEVLHVKLEVTPDFKARSVAGVTTLRFKPVFKPMRELQLDAIDLSVSEVTSTESVQAWQATKDKVIITFTQEIPIGKEASVTVRHETVPLKGIYFRTPEMGYKPGETHLFTQGEEAEARNWYPCIDSPNAMFTSEIICHVPEGMTVISNGKLLSEETAQGTSTFHWSQEKRHANYLITLVAGYFKKIKDRHGDIPLGFYVLPSELEQAASSFRNTRDMMEFFEKETGVPYPWAKYDQVCVNDFVAGGMENTSATTLTDSTLYPEGTENIHSSEGLVAHELAHQWFGDLVTCKDWSHTWLNESFATYFEALYADHHEGRDAMLWDLYEQSGATLGRADDTTPIVRRNFEDPGAMFSYLSYQKGSWVLHMLRSQLGPELFRDCVKTYLERHRHSNVVTEDLRRVVEERSGRSFDRFFDQWIFHGRFPDVQVNYTWDEPTRKAKVTIQQTQKVDPAVLLFEFPLTIRFKVAFGKLDRTVQITKAAEDFEFPLESAPKGVRIDPDYTLLAKIAFPIPNAMLEAQLSDKEDLVGRVLALEQLAKRNDAQTVKRLKQVLNEDSFHAVRTRASSALGTIRSPEALAALLESTQQPDARVRRQVVQDIGRFYRDKAYAQARSTVNSEKNPEIVSVAIGNLAGFEKPEVRELLLQFLNSESYHNMLTGAAIRAMRAEDDPQYIQPLIETLSKNREKFTSYGYEDGLSTLAYLARNEEKKDTVREFLMTQLTSENRRTRTASIQALGKLGDPKAIAALQKFAGPRRETREGPAAEVAISELRAARRPVDDFKNLRQEVTDLQKGNAELHDQLSDLKKKIETLKEPQTAAGKKSVKPLQSGKAKS